MSIKTHTGSNTTTCTQPNKTPLLNLSVKLLKAGYFSWPFSVLLRPHWIINPASGHTHTPYVPGSVPTQTPCMKTHKHKSRIFPPSALCCLSPPPSPAPLPFFFSPPRPPLSKPLLCPAVSMATLTSRWGRHPHSCCANTAMSHWHTLTHFTVETALTHGHWREYKMDRRMSAPGCSDAHLWFWGPNTQRSILSVMTTQRVFFFFF